MPNHRINEFYRKQIHLWMEYRDLIDEMSDDEMPPIYGGPWIRIHGCPLRESGRYAELMVARGERAIGLKEIRDFTREVKSLVIVDPYFLSGEAKCATSIADEFEKSARLAGRWLEKVHIIHSSDVTKAIKKAIEERAEKSNVRLTFAATDEIHDRVWIADQANGMVVGTSLNGIGNRVAFLLPLPKEDLNAFWDFLVERDLLKAQP